MSICLDQPLQSCLPATRLSKSSCLPSDPPSRYNESCIMIDDIRWQLVGSGVILSHRLWWVDSSRISTEARSVQVASFPPRGVAWSIRLSTLHPLCALLLLLWNLITHSLKKFHNSGLAALSSSLAVSFPCLVQSPVGELLSLSCCLLVALVGRGRFGWWGS